MKIQEIAELLKLNLHGGFYYGELSGYTAQLEFVNRGQLNICLLHIIVDKIVTKQDLKVLVEKTGIKHRIEMIDGMDFVTLSLIDLHGLVRETKKEIIRENVNNLINGLKELNFLPATQCIMCHEEKDEEMVYGFRSVKNYANVIAKVHNSCLNKSINRQVAEIEINSKNYGRLPLSIFLSCLGSFLVALITFIVALIFETWFGVLFFLIPLAGYYGYNLGKGPKNMFSVIFIIAESIIIPGLMIFIMTFMYATGAGVTISQAFSELLSDIGTIGFFLLIGIGVNIKLLLDNTNARKLRSLKK